jgi:hypothetical protein
LSEKSNIPQRWQKEQRTVKAVQIAFDVGEEVQYLIRREALDLAINPPDRIRQILGLPVNSKPVRPRLSISLSPQDFILLAEQFGVDPEDRIAIRHIAAEKLIQHLAKS